MSLLANSHTLRRRPASSSSDLDSRSKAAAWVWHMHRFSSDIPLGKFVSHPKSASPTCGDSRFRLEALQDFSPKPSASSRNVWDCGSKLYDSFELVSLTERLDRSLTGIPNADAANFLHAHSPLHQTSPGLLRTFSLPRNLSVNGGYSHSKARPTSTKVAGLESCCIPQSNSKTGSRKSSRKRWSSFGELLTILKNAATMHTRMRRRKAPDENEFDKQQEKQKDSRHFYHHHYHHHHHHLYRADDSEDAASNLVARKELNSMHTRATRVESARLSSATLSKFCLDRNWS